MKNTLRVRKLNWIETSSPTDPKIKIRLGFLEGNKLTWRNAFCSYGAHSSGKYMLIFFENFERLGKSVFRKKLTFNEAKKLAEKRLVKIRAKHFKTYYI